MLQGYYLKVSNESLSGSDRLALQGVQDAVLVSVAVHNLGDVAERLLDVERLVESDVVHEGHKLLRLVVLPQPRVVYVHEHALLGLCNRLDVAVHLVKAQATSSVHVGYQGNPPALVGSLDAGDKVDVLDVELGGALLEQVVILRADMSLEKGHAKWKDVSLA